MKRPFLISPLALAGILSVPFPFSGCLAEVKVDNVKPEKVESPKQAFGIKYTQDVTQARGHSWIMLKALQYLTARGMLPRELQGDNAVRNLTFGANFADDVFMGRPDQYPNYVWTPPDDELWTSAPGQVCAKYSCPSGQKCTRTCFPPSDFGKAVCIYCYPGTVVTAPPNYYYGDQHYGDTCDLFDVDYEFQLWLRTKQYSEAPWPTTAHETSIHTLATSFLADNTQDLSYQTDNLFHYALADLPAGDPSMTDPDITPDVRMFPHDSSDFDAGTLGDLLGVDTCAADLMGNQKIILAGGFGVATYGSILYQLSRRFFDNATYWPQPDISELIKAGSGSDIPSQWQNGGMDLSPHWSNLHTPFPYTYLGGNPFICTGGSKADPCAAGNPTWPAFVPTSQYSTATKDLFKQQITARYPGRSNMAAQVYLGWASHMIEDANLPHHAANWTGNEHKAQETAADGLAAAGEVLYKCPTQAPSSFPLNGICRLASPSVPGSYSLSSLCEFAKDEYGQRSCADVAGQKLTFDETPEMLNALSARFDSFTDKSKMCDAAGITDSSLLQSGINWQSSYGVFLAALKRGRTLAKNQNYGSKGHVADRFTMIIGVLADAIVDTMKLLYCAPPRTRNTAAPECKNLGYCWPGPSEEWHQGTISTTGQRYPMDFNIFAFGNVSVGDVEGPVAAAGTLKATSCSLNWGQKEPIGLYSIGYPVLSNGSIYGDLYTGGGAYTVPVGVTLSGKVVDASAPPLFIDFPTARQNLRVMSSALQSFDSNGTTSALWGNLFLYSNDAHLNVFAIPAATLAAARSVALSVPSSSTVVINVIGTTVTIQNVGITLNGMSMSHILWNFPNATTLTMASVGFPGSILAPYAAANLQWGDVTGTLVADSVNATTQFHWAPFHDNWLEPP